MTAQPATPREVIAKALAAAWDEGDDYGVLDESQEADRILAALAAHGMRIAGSDEAVVKIEPSDGLLISMALRDNHGLLAPEMPDDPIMKTIFGNITRAQRIANAMSSMRQLYDEVVGRGFWRKERDFEYCAMAGISAAEKASGGGR